MMRKLIFLFITVLFLAVSAEPVEISSIEELQKIGNEEGYPLDGTYVLTRDIDASKTAQWNDGKGFDPIGEDYHLHRMHMLRDTNRDSSSFSGPFTGSFDGQGHVIRNLTINRKDEGYVGLFRFIGISGKEGFVDALVLKDSSIRGRRHVGSLVGMIAYGTVSNSYATGSVAGDCLVGGLVGYNRGNISDSYATTDVKAEDSLQHVGGLVGSNKGSITGSYARGDVTSSGARVGGLVGYNRGAGAISDCYASGEVTGEVYVGSLVGSNMYGTIKNSYSTGSATGESIVGGLVGSNTDGTISKSYASGKAISKDRHAGGLVGSNHSYFYDSKIINVYATGDVKTEKGHAGGLVGCNLAGTISNSFAIGEVTGRNPVGGLVGNNTGEVLKSYWNKKTTGQYEDSHGKGRVTGEMIFPYAANTYENWNFDEIWNTDDESSKNNGYPYLQTVSLPSE